MFFDDEKSKSWKDDLTDDSKKILEEIEVSIKKYKCAYDHAEDHNAAKLWAAMIEMRRELNETKDMLGKLQEPWRAVVSVGEAEKKKAVERIVSDMIKPTDEETQEATKKLVESLMKF